MLYQSMVVVTKWPLYGRNVKIPIYMIFPQKQTPKEYQTGTDIKNPDMKRNVRFSPAYYPKNSCQQNGRVAFDMMMVFNMVAELPCKGKT